ncbi:methionine/alanine import family NSS transporter small subunit [Nocardiopsis sp. CNT312]|nr:methionine/alanine import family NSS transporter small subunit [Nocardiopsis sp. CNT312]
MSTSAIIMMAVAIVLVWGGLLAAVLNLHRNPEEPEHRD